MSEIKLGYSEKINDETITKALKKNQKIGAIISICAVIIPLIVGVVMSVGGNKDGITIGIGVSLVFFLCIVIPAIKKKISKEWEGTVISKEIKKVRRKVKDDYREEEHYIIHVQKISGAKTKIDESVVYHPYYDYLNEGDKIKYHPKFNNYYEKYDKTNDTYLYCAVCQTKNDIDKDHCTKCGAIILK